MKDNEKTLDITPRSSVEQAVLSSNVKKKGKMYYGAQPDKNTIASRVVENTVDNLLLSLSQPKCSYNDLDGIRARTVEYLQRCAESQCIPLIEDWAVALGISRSLLYRWFNDRSDKEVADFLERVRASIYAANAQAAYQNAINCVAWIFYGKNSLGMTDKTEISVSPSPAPPEYGDASPEELQKKYIDAIAIEQYDYEGE